VAASNGGLVACWDLDFKRQTDFKRRIKQRVSKQGRAADVAVQQTQDSDDLQLLQLLVLVHRLTSPSAITRASRGRGIQPPGCGVLNRAVL